MYIPGKAIKKKKNPWELVGIRLGTWKPVILKGINEEQTKQRICLH